jgi:hypothetical protein
LSKLENTQDSTAFRTYDFLSLHSAPAQLRRRILEDRTVDPSEPFVACLGLVIDKGILVHIRRIDSLFVLEPVFVAKMHSSLTSLTAAPIFSSLSPSNFAVSK